jgi:predicted nucleotidyltransferase
VGLGDDEVARRLRRALSEVPGVRLAFLFGSRARGQGRADSDFDVAVLVDAPQADDGSALRALLARLGREVSSVHLDVVVLNEAPVLLRHRVLRDGAVLFERDPEERPRFARRTLREYQDGAYRRALFTERRIQRLKSGGAGDGGPRDLLEKARSAARLLAAPGGVPRR